VTAHAVGQLLLALAAIMVLARALGALARRLGQPPVVGEIVAGILLGPSLFGTVVSDSLLPVDIRPALAGLANIGLVLFMFVVGYELDQTLVRGRQRTATAVSVGSVLAPLALGVGLALWLAPRHGVTDVLPFALFMGAAMAVTAFPVLARIVADRGMLRTEVGGLALASAAVDDVLAWSLLAAVVALGASGGALPWELLGAVPYVVVMFWGVRPLLRRLAAARDRAGRLTPTILGAILAGLLLSSWLTELIGLHAIFGAFLFGTVMPRGAEELRQEILERIEQVSVLLLLPVFFVTAGLRVDLSTVGGAGLVELALILLVAVAGKFLGAYAGARLCRVPRRHAGALATLMNTRGLTEIVILTVGLQLGILDGRLFSMMVVMALVTTAMAGPLLSLIYPRRLVDRDIAAAQRAALRGDGYRVLALAPAADTAAGATTAGVSPAAVVGLAADLADAAGPGAGDAAGAGRPAPTVALARLVPYPTASVEVGSGLSGSLAAMTATMAELAGLSAPLRARGLTAPVVARFTSDAATDLAELVESAEPDVAVAARGEPGLAAAVHGRAGAVLVTVDAVPSHPVGTILARVDGDHYVDATLRVAAQLAAARDAELVVDAGRRVPRGVAATVRELERHGVRVRLGADRPADALVVVADGGAAGDGAHLRVRAAGDAGRDDPAGWVARLAVRRDRAVR
jgi:Kef-type K+ transport system membrane component KefB